MHPILFEVFGRQIYTYGLFIVIGAVAAWFLLRLLVGKENKDMPNAFFICVCGGLIGAFALRPLMKIPEVILHWERFRQMPVEMFFAYFFGEIVFYGGLIGGATAMLLFCRRFKIPVLPMVDLFAPALALAHGIGRIGCFMGGCCYGIPVSPSHPFAVVFQPAPTAAPPTTAPIIIAAPIGVPLLGTQLIEAACLILLAAILAIIYKKTTRAGLTVCLYGLLYSVLRFVLEFYRGDMIRGVYGWFSTSQYISIALFAVSLTLLIVRQVKTKNRPPSHTYRKNREKKKELQ